MGDEDAPALGVFCSLPSAAAVEMAGWAGFDFVILDAEHTLVGPHELAHMLRAAEAAGVRALVRVPGGGSGWGLVGPVLDAGAAGIVVPRVRSRADAAAAVRAVRYHPVGHRGLDAGRATRYGRGDLATFVREARADVVLVAMVEDREGVEAIEDIVSVSGFDAVLEGAADLSQSLGRPWQTGAAEVQRALERVQEACTGASRAFWAVPRRPGEAGRWFARGVRTFVCGDIRNIAARALQERLREARESLRA